MAHSERKREAVEVAARPLRELLVEEHDEIAAAQRALRHAEKVHDRASELAERQLRAARSARPLAAYGHEVILYADRISTADGNHQLTPKVRATVEPGTGSHETVLAIDGPGWRREIAFPRRDKSKMAHLAEDIEAAGRVAGVLRDADRAIVEHSELEIAQTQADRAAIDEVRNLMHMLGDLVEPGEDVVDMAPGVSAGHDGVLVATDRRLLFVGLRRTLAFPYETITRVAVKGKWFGSRLALTTPDGTGVISGISPRHAHEIADLVGSLRPG